MDAASDSSYGDEPGAEAVDEPMVTLAPNLTVAAAVESNARALFASAAPAEEEVCPACCDPALRPWPCPAPVAAAAAVAAAEGRPVALPWSSWPAWRGCGAALVRGVLLLPPPHVRAQSLHTHGHACCRVSRHPSSPSC